MQLCNECPKRNTCVELCEAAENYVNQDYIKLNKKEILIDDIEHITNTTEWPAGEIDLTIKDWIYLIKTKPDLTILQKRYLYIHYWQNKSYEQIANKYKVSRQNVSEIVNSAKKKLSTTLTLLL